MTDLSLTPTPGNSFELLAAVNVNEHVEKKAGLSYLSWAWAVDQLLRRDHTASWTYAEPRSFGETMMVACTVEAFGIKRTMQLPVMDHRNKAIANPDAFQVNTAMQRCLVKAIALHGLGLYIYAGEDLPEGEEPELKKTPLPAAIPANIEGKELFAALPLDAQTVVKDDVAEMSALVKDGDLASALEIIKARYSSHEDQLILASQMHSTPRNKLKEYGKAQLEARKQNGTQPHLAEQA